MTATAAQDAAALLSDLSVCYGWALTGTESALLRAAFTGHTRTGIADVAAKTAGQHRTLTPSQLCAALRAEPETPTQRAPMYHLPICQCEGAGVIRTERLVQGRPIPTAIPCEGNRGQPVTRDQWDRYQREHGATDEDTPTGKIPDRLKAEGRAGLARARAQLTKEPAT